MPSQTSTPASPKVLDNSSYQKLLARIRSEMQRGVTRIEELLDRQKVLTYWAIGRRINVYLAGDESPRGSIGLFYRNLARDSGIHDRTLQQCEQFFRYFPKLKIDKQLKWSHYRFLLVEPDSAKRQAWIERIKKENIPADQLRLALMPSAKKDVEDKAMLETPVRGKLFTYRLLRAEDIENFDVPWFVDLGFAGRKEAPDSKAVLDNKNLYTSEKAQDGSYRFKVTKARVEELFTFRGKLKRVIDGDTLFMDIDQGFSYWNTQRLRLKGIDAPEMDTLAGQRAKKWVEDELKDCRNIVVKTYKSDQWDRYLVDVFYASRPKGAGVTAEEWDLHRIAAQGAWLNGRMVEAGVARVWKTSV